MWGLPFTAEKFFSIEQRKQVEALFNAIIPGDATAPSAADVNAAEYIDRLLKMEGSVYYEIDKWRNQYAAGLSALDAASAALNNGATVTQLPKDRVTDLLDRLSKSQLSSFPEGLDQKGFFETLRNHCIEGCFADPRWGGNRDNRMWRWFGYLQQPEETMWRYSK